MLFLIFWLSFLILIRGTHGEFVWIDWNNGPYGWARWDSYEKGHGEDRSSISGSNLYEWDVYVFELYLYNTVHYKHNVCSLKNTPS